jgi:cob(I)alamin adenosyltransferase
VPGPKHRGDGGETGLLGGQRVRKDDARIECLGAIDELSSFLGLAAAALAGQGANAAALLASVRRIQRELYRLGAELGRREPGADGPAVGGAEIATLDREVEDFQSEAPALRAFILPGGGEVAAILHVARAVCRRAERHVVRLASVEPVGAAAIPYLNRLSLALFAMARHAAHRFGTGDDLA